MTAITHRATNFDAFKDIQTWLSSGIVKLLRKTMQFDQVQFHHEVLKNQKHKIRAAIAFKFPAIMLSIAMVNMITYLIFQLASEVKYISIKVRRATHVHRRNSISYDPSSIYFTNIAGFS